MRIAGLALLAVLLAGMAFLGGWATAVKGGYVDDSLRRLRAAMTGGGVAQPSRQVLVKSPAWREKATFFTSFNTRARVVMVGDSITDGAEWGEMFPGLAVANRGIDGDNTQGVLMRMDGISSLGAERAFVMIGINDFIRGRGADEVFDDYARIVAALRASGMQVVVQSTLQCNPEIGTAYRCAELMGKIHALNRRLPGLAAEGVTYVDINIALADAGGLKTAYTYDGVHLNGDGYRAWKTVIAALMP